MAWGIFTLRKYPNNLLFIQNPDCTVGPVFSFARSAAWHLGPLHSGLRSATSVDEEVTDWGCLSWLLHHPVRFSLAILLVQPGSPLAFCGEPVSLILVEAGQ